MRKRDEEDAVSAGLMRSHRRKAGWGIPGHRQQQRQKSHPAPADRAARRTRREVYWQGGARRAACASSFHRGLLWIGRSRGSKSPP